MITDKLTVQQARVLLYMADDGLSAEQTAQVMGLSVKTIRNHTANICQKLDKQFMVEVLIMYFKERLDEKERRIKRLEKGLEELSQRVSKINDRSQV